MRRKIVIGSGIFLALVILTNICVPVFASNSSGAAQITAQGTQQITKGGILARLLLIQDEAKVDAIIAKALAAGKINADQAAKIKAFWTNHHQQFTKRVVAKRLLRANDITKVQAFLDGAVAAGKITPQQEQNILALWNKLHSK